jgi:hypothetical protein
MEAHQTSGKSRRRNLHGFIAHGDAQHPASADEFVE